MLEAKTEDIKVEVHSHYVEEESDPSSKAYFFAYHVRITNEGKKTVQLLNRKWLITDGQGRTEEVKGPGVAGVQPLIRPGESFEYDSFCPLETPQGQMQGNYEMEYEDGSKFEAQVPEFYLIEPNSCH